MKKKDIAILDYSIDSVVAICSPELIKRFHFVNRLRTEAHEMLFKCSDMESDIWKDVYKEYGISEDYYYKINYNNGEVVVVGNKYGGNK